MGLDPARPEGFSGTTTLTSTPISLGRSSSSTPREKFVNNDEANKMLTRDYRAPFVVTEEV